MYHVELRRFPHLARVFNLSEHELRERFVLPWITGRPISLDDRTWTTEKTRLTIYEGPEVAAEERGLGRGWSSVTRSGQEVTKRLLETATASSPLAELKQKLLDAAPLPLHEVLAVLGAAGRPSERLALAEQAVWELLHEGRAELGLAGEAEPLGAERWQPLLLDWGSWAGSQATSSAIIRSRSSSEANR